jgi:hypothetical protein
MNQSTMIMLAIGLAVILVVAWLIYRQRHSRRLRSQFGPEYDRMVLVKGSPRGAEAELDRRSRRVRRLAIRPLPQDAVSRYEQRWNAQQARFVDEPREAVAEADHLVEEVMKERGYPMADFEQRAADISVDHPRVVENYRAAHQIALREQQGRANTEDLRNAMICYRELFRDLLEDPLRPAGVPSR